MDFVPGAVVCATCDRTADSIWDVSICTLCDKVLCRDHAIIDLGVVTCQDCVKRRADLEASSGVTDADEASVIALLRADVLATIGPGHEGQIKAPAAHARLYPYPVDPTGYVAEVVNQLQQIFHDDFIDTSWPACPLHPNHPLWFSDGWWRCERTNTPIAPLGQLSTVNKKDG